MRKTTSTAGNYRTPINPFDCSHRVDNEASYAPKKRAQFLQWQHTTDKSVRSTTSGKVSQPNTISSHDKDFKSNVFSWREEPSKPTFESLTSDAVHDLDKRNRFFTDNKKLYMTYRHKAPQQYVYRDLEEDEPRPPAHVVQDLKTAAVTAPTSSAQHG